MKHAPDVQFLIFNNNYYYSDWAHFQRMIHEQFANYNLRRSMDFWKEEIFEKSEKKNAKCRWYVKYFIICVLFLLIFIYGRRLRMPTIIM